jgi:hypothetical protein
MPGRMIWHDTRLKGAAPAIAPNIHLVNKDTDLAGSITWIANYAGAQSGLDELIIMCHGMEADWNLQQQISTGRQVGGFGLQLCKQGLGLRTVGHTMRWKGGGPLIRRITVYACGTAQTGPGNSGTWGDGRRFMGELAINSGAYVVAGRDAQVYNPESVRLNNPMPIDFGDWEGPVYLFDPTDGSGKLFNPGPMN